MKNKFWIRILCVVLIAVSVLAPISASAASVKLLKTTVDNVRFHNQATGAVKLLHKGTKLLYWGKHKSGNNNMILVMTHSRTRGYVYKQYCSVYGAFAKSSIYYTRNSTPVYTSSGKVKARLGAYTLVQVITTNKSVKLSYIKSMSGKKGWVYTGFLKRAF